ncbi:MAG TPA: ABC transporter substrate binding protein [Patescibacteria group bacterium]|nr:ABC transporter substrate binding protein [Patescibacteria group bacterium]
MRRKISFFLLIVVFCLLMPVRASDDSFSTAPRQKNGGKWRIGYYEAGPYPSYTLTFGNIVKALAKLGWLDNVDACPFDSDSRTIWQWLGTHSVSQYLEFPPDAYYSYNDEEALHGPVRESLLRRLTETTDLDLMLALGTLAAQDLANDRHGVPVMVFSVSNAVKAGIVVSEEDSGRNHVWSHVEPDRYKRQVELFYDIFHFKKLGIVYEDTIAGRSYAALDDVEDLARERGFEIVRAFYDDSVLDPDLYHQNLLEAYRQVATEADAFYLTPYTRLQNERLGDILTPLVAKKLPTLSWSVRLVPHGVLMAVALADFEYIGAFDAENIARVLNGARPRSLNQIFISPPSIVLNLEAADRIRYVPPFPILLAADKIYLKIEGDSR